MKILRGAAMAVMALAWGVAARATLVTYNISGAIAAYKPYGSANTFSGSFTFDTSMILDQSTGCYTSDTVATCIAQPYSGYEHGASYGIYRSVGPMSFSLTSGSFSMSGGSGISQAASINIYDGAGTNQGIKNPDSFSFYLGQTSINNNSYYYSYFSSSDGNFDGVEIDLFDSSGTAFNSTALTSSLSLSKFSSAQIKLYGVAHDPTVYNITSMALAPPANPQSAVPESASWSMMILGFGVVGGTLRRQRRMRAWPRRLRFGGSGQWKTCRNLAAAGLLLIIAGEAPATVMTYYFDGTSNGTPFSGSFTYDTGVHEIGTSFGRFTPTGSFSMTVGSSFFTASINPSNFSPQADYASPYQDPAHAISGLYDYYNGAHLLFFNTINSTSTSSGVFGTNNAPPSLIYLTLASKYGIPLAVGGDGYNPVVAASLALQSNGSYSYTIDTVSTTPIPAASSAVPEPASWTAMIAGFGMVGGATRLRQRRILFT